MTRETRIALLVGLAFIVLFGLVLGQRSLSLSSSARAGPAASSAPGRTARAPDILITALTEREDHPALAPPRGGPPTAAGGRPPATQPPADVVQGTVLALSQPPAGDASLPPSPTTRPAEAGRTYVIQPGDTLIGIARKVYGRGHEGEYQRIYQANRDKLTSVSALAVGRVLAIPAPEAPAPAPRPAAVTELTPEQFARRLAPSRTYVVRRGDHLAEIARRTLGSDSRSALKRLMDANRDRLEDPDRLRVGMSLRIPS